MGSKRRNNPDAAPFLLLGAVAVFLLSRSSAAYSALKPENPSGRPKGSAGGSKPGATSTAGGAPLSTDEYEEEDEPYVVTRTEGTTVPSGQTVIPPEIRGGSTTPARSDAAIVDGSMTPLVGEINAIADYLKVTQEFIDRETNTLTNPWDPSVVFVRVSTSHHAAILFRRFVGPFYYGHMLRAGTPRVPSEVVVGNVRQPIEIRIAGAVEEYIKSDINGAVAFYEHVMGWWAAWGRTPPEF